jgi:transcriptional regulator with XRE-family HTH domain
LTPHRFAHNLRCARLHVGLTQAELAYRCDLHRTEVSLLERGGREPRLGVLVKLAAALDTDIDALLIAPLRARRAESSDIL